jgi:lipopolysaccharide export system ATP-binding protein
LLSFLNPFGRGKARRSTVPTSDLFRIDLGPVEESMRNGHAERMTFTTTERMAVGKAKRAVAPPPIGRTAERDFDWKSVQPPDHWREEPAHHRPDEEPHEDDPFRHDADDAFGRNDDDPFTRNDQNGFDDARARNDSFGHDGSFTHENTFARNGYDPAPALAPAAPAAYPINPRRTAHALEKVTPESGALTIQGVQKSFGKRMVVRGVSLTLRRGEAVGLLGPNGAGKTTVFYMITGLIKADKGSIQFDGHDITHLPMYQRARLGIGYLPQEASIFRGLNVEDNIRAVLEVVEPSKKKREMELDKLLDEFNIARLRKTPSIALSGGERRRTEIARALATRPAYMLLDEPFAGIDPIAVGDIQNLVHHLKERGIGVLITDHNVRETLGLTDRAYIIYSGEVLREGRAEEIVNDPEVRRLYLGEEFRM